MPVSPVRLLVFVKFLIKKDQILVISSNLPLLKPAALHTIPYNLCSSGIQIKLMNPKDVHKYRGEKRVILITR